MRSAGASKPAKTFVFLAAMALFLGLNALPSLAQNGPLSIRPVQVLNTNGNRICQHVFENGTYKLAWQSAPLEGYHSVRMGDIDNDGQKEIVATVEYQTRIETIKIGKKTTTRAWDLFRIEIFEDGAAYDGGPSWWYDIPGEVMAALPNDSYIADIDNDSMPGYPDNELVLIRSTELDLFHFPGQQTVPIKEHLCTYASFLFSLEVGDADNDGFNELIVVPGNSSSLRIWKHLVDHSWEQNIADPVPSSLWGHGMTYAGVTYMRVRNVDNMAGNEIIATGNNERLMVWKYDGEGYRLVSWSQEMTSYMAYGIDSGDLDGNGSTEVVIDLWGGRRYSPRLVVLAFESADWILKGSYETDYLDQRDLRMADLDGCGRPEVAMNIGGEPEGLKLFKFIGALSGGTFQEVYAAPGYGYGKVEIR